MAPNVIEVSDFKYSMVNPTCKLPSFPYSSEQEDDVCSNWIAADRLSDHGSFESIAEEVEGEDELQDSLVAKQDVGEVSIAASSASSAQSHSSSSTSVSTGSNVGVTITGAGSGTTSSCAGIKNRQIVKCMCSSALMLVSITALLLLLPLVLPPLPPPPSELMLLPVAILLLLVCAALSPRSPSLPACATSAASPQSVPLLPLVHSLPLRSTMPC